MKQYALNEIDAAKEIHEGMKYISNISVNTRASASLPNIFDKLSMGLSAGANIAAFPAPQESMCVEKIVFKNTSLNILVPVGLDSVGEYFIDKAPQLMLPGDECELSWSYKPEAYSPSGMCTVTFLVINADPGLLGDLEEDTISETRKFSFRIVSDRFNTIYLDKFTLNDSVINSNSTTEGYNSLNYISYRGAEGTREPSFGLAFTPVNAASVTNNKNATALSYITFTPSAIRHSGGLTYKEEKPGNSQNEIVTEMRLRSFLQVCRKVYLKSISYNTRALGFVPNIINAFAYAGSIYSSIAARTNSKSYFTVNVRNLTAYPIYILRQKFSDSKRTGNEIVIPGETVALPVSMGSFRPKKPQILMRINKSNKFFYNMFLNINDGGPNRNIYAEEINTYTSDKLKDYWTDKYKFSENSINKIRYQPGGFIDEKGSYQALILPNVISSRTNPTMDVVVVAE